MAIGDAVFARLRRVLDQPDTVILVGSGVSLWSGLPTWAGLLAQLADFLETNGLDRAPVDQELKGGDLLLAASYAVHQLHSRDLGRFIRSALNHPHATPSELHRIIANLGPSCFVTTNYDHLLEIAIRQSPSAAEPLIVTNRQPVEAADIISAKSRNFVFKYHGDLTNAESIVLSREQYRCNQMDYPGIVRALSTLLSTRPVFMIGFGLRDPDFLMVQNELVSIFQGQAGEYFAIQPDCDAVRADYWRKTYRTEVVSYTTVSRSDGTRDHKGLLDLLRKLQATAPFYVRPIDPPNPRSRERLLLLARLAASISRQKPLPADPFLPLSVEFKRTPNRHFFPHRPLLRDLLRCDQNSLLLLGLPGAGKSFALRNYVAEIADALTVKCLSDEAIPNELSIPLFANLATYAGNLRALLQDTLPAGLSLNDLLHLGRCVVVLDAANEMPRDYIESGRWLADFNALRAEFPGARVIVGARSEPWLDKIELPTFVIGDIEADFVASYFSHETRAVLNPEILRTLANPLLFSLAHEGELDVTAVTTPNSLYLAYFAKIDAEWESGRGVPITFAGMLKSVAYDMLERGVEYATKEQFDAALAASLADPDKAIALLLRTRALLPLSGRRLTFFHQSVTEYLAARVVAERFEKDPSIINSLLKTKRWDQTLFLAMGLLSKDSATAFFDKVLTVDLAAAARASYYVENDQEGIISRILKEAIRRGPPRKRQGLWRIEALSTEFWIDWSLRTLPYQRVHASLLENLAQRPDPLGGSAQGILFVLIPERRLSIIEDVLQHAKDDDRYNYLQNFFRASKDVWTITEVRHLFDRIPLDYDEHSLGHQGSEILEKLSEQDILKLCSEFMGRGSAAQLVLIDKLSETDRDFATDTLKEYFVREPKFGAYYLFKHVSRLNKPLEVDNAVITAVAQALSSSASMWSIDLGRALISANEDWAEPFRQLRKVARLSERSMLDIILSTPENIGEALNQANPTQ